jgi:hypothetical protein
MSMYLFNCSVDTPDQCFDHIPEDLQINDQESIIELVLEIGLGMDDAIPEKEDADADQKFSSKKQVTTDLYAHSNLERRLKFNSYPTKSDRVYFSTLIFELPVIPISRPPPEY